MDTEGTTSPTFENELDRYLASVERDDSYRVERVLKSSDAETTELVAFEGAAGGSLGPFVRKRIATQAQIGGTYELLFQAQQAGRRFGHLPKIIECRRTADELQVVMEHVPGETLETAVHRLGPSAALVDAVMPELCRAVGELHAGLGLPGEPSAPVIHRDLKPSNIIVSGARMLPSGNVAFSSLVLIDLGIAREYRSGADADTVKFGTRSYAPPEQYGFGQTSVRSDVYALGGLLYFCLTGCDPDPSLGPAELAAQAEVPQRFAQVIERAMAFDPAARYRSAADVAAALAGEALDSTEEERPAEKSHPRRRAVNARAALRSGIRHMRQPHADRHKFMDRLRSLPEGVGRAWNIWLYICLVILLWSSWLATFSPTGANVNMPTWFLALEYLVMLNVCFVTTMFVLLDKRRWRRRFPALEQLRGKRLALWYIGINGGIMIAVSMIGSGLHII